MNNHSLKSKLKNILGLCATMGIALQCANPGTPTGGPRDYDPPVLVSSRPAQFATSFSGNVVTLVFNENVQLKDIDTKFVVSPPMEKTPRVEANANIVRVRFEGEFLPSTTYTLDFADCLSDLNEGNVAPGFTFTFSTGESTDTMMISGNIYHAATVAPVKGIYVLLHSNLQDTAFIKSMPMRIAKTDEYGRFAIKNVPADRSYRIYALDDQNKNFKFDQPGETVAWLTDSVRPSFEIRQINDSVRIDSLSTSADTSQWVFEPVVRDTLVYTPDSLVLFSFLEDYYDQYIVNDQRSERRVLKIMFNKPMATKPEISFPGQDNSVAHSVNEFSLHNDTCTIWLTDSLIYGKDSVVVSLKYPVLDSLKQMTTRIDTLDLWHFEKKVDDKKDNRRRKRDKEPKKVEVPLLKVDVPGTIGSFSVLPITCQTPFDKFDWDGVRLYHKVDTIFEQMTYTFDGDTVNLRRKTLKANWQPGEEYKLEIDSAAVVDIYGLQCGPKTSTIKVNTLDKYGSLYIDVDSVPANGLLQLVNAKDEVIRQNYLPSNGKLAFRYLKPSDYMIRIVIDDNRNGQWDTGNYEAKRQPERLIYYMEKVTVRANWDIRVEFSPADYTPDKYARKFKVKTNKRTSNRNRY